jgi:NADH-quinone oxidoreductase subunit E
VTFDTFKNRKKKIKYLCNISQNKFGEQMDYIQTSNHPTDQEKNSEIQKKIDQILNKNQGIPGATMVVLNEVQSEIGYITDWMQVYIAQKMRVPVSSIHGVVTFYSFFTTQPRGRHTIKFCMGTACYVGGTPQLIEKAKQMLKTDIGKTTPDGGITLEVCRCVGACSQAPVVVVDEEVQGRVRPNKFPQILRKCQD